MRIEFLIFLLTFVCGCTCNSKKIYISRWTYIQVDSTRGKWNDYGDKPAMLRYFGLAMADVDKDGDKENVTNEHKGQVYKTQIFQNDGHGNFTEILVDIGKESHLGTQLADMDQDGDLDIVSIAWDFPKFLHLWRNEGIVKKANFIE